MSKVKIEGLDALLNSQLKGTKEEIDQLLGDVALFIRDFAKTTSKFKDKTGNLRRSIVKRRSKFIDGGFIVVAAGRNQGAGFHAHLVEKGHRLVAWGNYTDKFVEGRKFMEEARKAGEAYAEQKIREFNK